MRVIHCWPGDTETGLPPEVQTALLEVLMGGFESETTARTDWETTGSVLLVIEEGGSCFTLSADLQHQIQFALQYSDDMCELSGGWVLRLVISNDESGSYYLVSPKETSIADAYRNANV